MFLCSQSFLIWFGMTRSTYGDDSVFATYLVLRNNNIERLLVLNRRIRAIKTIALRQEPTWFLTQTKSCEVIELEIRHNTPRVSRKDNGTVSSEAISHTQVVYVVSQVSLSSSYSFFCV
jgi:hypothetical protein